MRDQSWKMAGKNLKLKEGIRVEKLEDCVKVRVSYGLSYDGKYDMAYSISDDGRVRIGVEYTPGIEAGFFAGRDDSPTWSKDAFAQEDG